MKLKFKNKEYEINELTQRQRFELISYSGVAQSKMSGESLGELMVKVFELSGLKDSDFEGLREIDQLELIRKIQESWKVEEKK